VLNSRRWVASLSLVVLLLGALALGACGGSDGGGDSTSTASTDAKAPKGTPLKLGLLVNATGPLPSGEENAAQVMQAWARAVNGAGGVAGHPVEIEVADTKGDAPTATAAVQRLVKDDSVIAAVMFDAATEGLVAEAITRAGLPVVGGMGYAPNAWGAMPNWLPLTTSIPSIFNMGMMLGDHLGGTRTAMTICAEIAGCAAAEPVVTRAAKVLGMSYEGTFKIAASAPSYTAQCLQLIDKQVDYVMLGAATTSAALRVARDCKTQGYDGQWGLFGGVIFPRVMREEDPGMRLGLVLNSFPWFADEAPVASYRDTMESQGVAEDVYADLHSTAAYATVELFKKALEADAASLPANPTRSDVIAAYGSVRDETLDGLLPQPITFHPDRPNPLVTCYWFGSYEQGTFSDGHLDQPECDPASLKG
jgi:branched-chain amino acid transport system substrate-binding protein